MDYEIISHEFSDADQTIDITLKIKFPVTFSVDPERVVGKSCVESHNKTE